MRRGILLLLLVALVTGLVAPDAAGWAPVDPQSPGNVPIAGDALGQLGVQLPGAAPLPGDDGQVPQPGRFSKALEIAFLLTALSLLPAILITITSFTRIVIVLSFVRRALSINELPPNPVIIGLALFLTVFVMAPVGKRVYSEAWLPYEAGTVSAEEAGGLAWGELRGFLIANTREKELAMFSDMVHASSGAADASVHANLEASPSSGSSSGPGALTEPPSLADAPAMVVVPAFILSELKTAFQMGFLLFLPFLVIDLIVSSVLLSMGMFMLPPVMISTPFKILVFVLVDGWRLICESVVTSFITT